MTALPSNSWDAPETSLTDTTIPVLERIVPTPHCNNFVRITAPEKINDKCFCHVCSGLEALKLPAECTTTWRNKGLYNYRNVIFIFPEQAAYYMKLMKMMVKPDQKSIQLHLIYLETLIEKKYSCSGAQ